MHAPVGLVVAVEVHTPHRDRPSTGDFQMAVSTWRPCHSTTRRAPTFTDTTTPATSPSTSATV